MQNDKDFILGDTSCLDYKPIDTAVMIEVDKVEETSAGGIQLPEGFIEKEQMMRVEGVIVAMGDYAYKELKDAKFNYPNIGDKVLCKKYSGVLHYNEIDKRRVYRIIQDTDVIAIKQNSEVKND
jgi:co-chaperonin GroES (HSP10)